MEHHRERELDAGENFDVHRRKEVKSDAAMGGSFSGRSRRPGAMIG
jgi:hypothetical protein